MQSSDSTVVSSSFGVVDIPSVTPKSAKPKLKPVSKFLERRLKSGSADLLSRAADKKAARKLAKKGIRPTGKLSKAAHKVAVRKASVKKIMKGVKPVTKGAKSNVGACSICGKPLTRGSSVSAGMGDVCSNKGHLLAKGETLEQHMEKVTRSEIPAGFMPLSEAWSKLRKAGYSTYRIQQAVGGNGLFRPPLNSYFKTVYVGSRKYINAECLKHMSDMKKL